MSTKVVIAGAVAAIAVFAAVVYYARDPSPAPPAAPASATPAPAPAAAVPPAPVQSPKLQRVDASARPVAPDPRLAAIMGPAVRDDRVEYLAGPDGRVIQEIDQDPSSRGFRRPLREYLYAGDKIAGVTTYRYLGDQVQVIRARVSYKPDGTIDKFDEATEYTPDSAPAAPR